MQEVLVEISVTLFQSQEPREETKMSGEKDELVQKAKLAEQAERCEGVESPRTMLPALNFLELARAAILYDESLVYGDVSSFRATRVLLSSRRSSKNMEVDKCTSPGMTTWQPP